MKTLYYCNKPCKLIKKLPETDESIIQVCSYIDHINEGSWDEPPFSEPEFNTIIVSNKYITNAKVNLEEQWDGKLKELEEIYNTKNKELSKQMNDLNNELSKIKTLLKKYRGVDIMLEAIDCTDEEESNIWVLTMDSWGRPTINTLNEIRTATDYYTKTSYKKSITFIREKKTQDRKGSIYFTINKNSDGSGSNTKCFIFRTFEEAKNELLRQMKIHKKWSDYIEIHDKYDLKIPEIGEAKKDREAKLAASKQKQKAELLKKLEALKV